MKTRHIICFTFITAWLAAGFAGCAWVKGEREEHCCKEKTEKHDQEKLIAIAKVSKADAEKTALAKVPDGTIKEGEIENEHGKLIWSFDISTPDSKEITEVNIDADSGEVLSTKKESATKESKEKEDEEEQGKHEDKQ